MILEREELVDYGIDYWTWKDCRVVVLPFRENVLEDVLLFVENWRFQELILEWEELVGSGVDYWTW